MLQERLLSYLQTSDQKLFNFGHDSVASTSPRRNENKNPVISLDQQFYERKPTFSVNQNSVRSNYSKSGEFNLEYSVKSCNLEEKTNRPLIDNQNKSKRVSRKDFTNIQDTSSCLRYQQQQTFKSKSGSNEENRKQPKSTTTAPEPPIRKFKRRKVTAQQTTASSDSFFQEFEAAGDCEVTGVDSSSIWSRKPTGENKIDEIRRLFDSCNSTKSPSKSLSDFKCINSRLKVDPTLNNRLLGEKVNEKEPENCTLDHKKDIKAQVKRFEAYDNFRGSRTLQSPTQVTTVKQEEINPIEKFFERKLSISNIKEFNNENIIFADKLKETTKSKSSPCHKYSNAVQSEKQSVRRQSESKTKNSLTSSHNFNEVPKLLSIDRRLSIDNSIESSAEFFTPRSFRSSSGLSGLSGLFAPTDSKLGKSILAPRIQGNSHLNLKDESDDTKLKNTPSSNNLKNKCFDSKQRDICFKNVETRSSSSNSTEVVISDRESVTDSGDVNRRTIIHISRNRSLSSPSASYTNNYLASSSEFYRSLSARRSLLSDRFSDLTSCSTTTDNQSSVTSGRIRVSISNGGCNKGASTSLQEFDPHACSSRMFVKQSDALNRPSRASAFNVRKTIEKRVVEQERLERKALRRKLKEQQRNIKSSDQQQREELLFSSTDSDISSVYVSCSSVRSKSLSSLDQDQDDYYHRCNSPLVKVQSSLTLEVEKELISNYLYASNLVDCSPCHSSRLVANVMSPACSNSAISNSNNSHNSPAKTTYLNVTLPDDSKVLADDTPKNDERSITDNEKWRMKQTTNQKDSSNKYKIIDSKENSLSNKPYKSATHLSLSDENEKCDPALVRLSRDRRSLRTNQLMLEDISERTSSIASAEPDWVKRARKRLEALNIPLCSTTEAGSASSHVTETSSAWSRGGLDALDDLRQETSRIGFALAGEAQARVVKDLKLISREANMLEASKSIQEAISEAGPGNSSVLNDMEAKEEMTAVNLKTNVKWNTAQLPQSPKEEVRFGDLKHDWGGVQTANKTSASGKPKEMRFGSIQVTDIPSNKEKQISSQCHSFSSKSSSLSSDSTRRIEKSSSTGSLPVMRFGDTPINVLPSYSPNSPKLEPKASSKFESISGPDPTTMSADQLNQNVEEYGFPIPTGKEDATELLKFLEESIKKVEEVPQIISSEDLLAKPKSILKRRSVENVYQETQKEGEDLATERMKRRVERRKSSPAQCTTTGERVVCSHDTV